MTNEIITFESSKYKKENIPGKGICLVPCTERFTISDIKPGAKFKSSNSDWENDFYIINKRASDNLYWISGLFGNPHISWGGSRGTVEYMLSQAEMYEFLHNGLLSRPILVKND